MPLSNPFRRTADRPSLRERAAALRASFHHAAAVTEAPLATSTDDLELLALAGPWEAATAAYDATLREQIAVSEKAPTLEAPPAWDPYDDWLRLIPGWRERTGVNAAEAASQEAMSVVNELEDRIAATPATTMAGLRLKARVAQRSDRFEIVWPDGFGEGLVRDILRMSEPETIADADLLRLGRLFEAARAREMAACEACNAAAKEARNHMPERPAALRYRASDHALYLHKHYTSPEYLDGREITSDDVEWVSRKRHVRDVRRPVRPEDKLPADAQFVVGQEPWPEAQARADGIVAAWEAWHAEINAVYAAHGLPGLEETADKAGDATAALAERLAAIPARTAEGFRLKLRALAFYRHSVLEPELEDVSDPDQILSHSLWRDVQGELPEALPAREPNLVSLIDLASATMEDLQALHDTAQSLGDAAGAFAWTARCHTKGWASYNAPGDGHNAAGRLMQWLGDALSNVQHAANEEAKRRVAANSDDREIRWQIIARPILENDDPAEIAAFARDLRNYAEQHEGDKATDPVLALIAESLREEEAAADLEASWQSIPLAERAAREDAVSDRQAKARDAALKTLPTTREGLKAFTDYVGFQASLTYGSDWRAKVSREMGGDLLVALCAAVETAADA